MARVRLSNMKWNYFEMMLNNMKELLFSGEKNFMGWTETENTAWRVVSDAPGLKFSIFPHYQDIFNLGKLFEMNEIFPSRYVQNDKHFTVNNELDQFRNVLPSPPLLSTANFWHWMRRRVAYCEYNQIGRVGICISNRKWWVLLCNCYQVKM